MDNETKTLDTLRRRLITITKTLQILRDDLANPQTLLPPWPLILSACQDLANNLSDLQTFTLNSKAFENLDLHIPGYNVPSFLERAHVYPTNDFPASEEGALGMLLNRKYKPEAEEWVEGALKAANGANEATERGEQGMLSAEQLQELWKVAVLETQDKAGRMEMEDLPGDDDEDEDDDEDDEEQAESDEEMEDAEQEGKEKGPLPKQAVPMMKLEDVLRFMTTGTVR